MLIDVDLATRKRWQEITDTIAELYNIPAALIMHVENNEISVFSSSQSKGNPYKVGDSEHFHNSGLYCEWVIKNQERLLVPNAHKLKLWKDNPDIKLNMISYLGFPVNYPNGKPFGTFCILDNKENAYSPLVEKHLRQIRDMIEDHLTLLSQRMKLIHTLQGGVPICATCKKVRDDDNHWSPIDEFIQSHSNAQISHGICPDCAQKLLGEFCVKLSDDELKTLLKKGEHPPKK